ncbi:MAG: hypothetical protein M5U10_17780 [Candidatus Methanoperedens sp.]|nr:hypothetical protein [Candidatus Methanoperedens sp.]
MKKAIISKYTLSGQIYLRYVKLDIHFDIGKYGISEMVVWVRKATGKIETAFPKSGADVWAWNGIDNWINVI